MRQFFLNGKFTAQRTTGVQRVASRLIEALDARLSDQSALWVLLCPVGSCPPVLKRIQVRHVGMTGLPLHLWEQIVLPYAAASGLLVNLAGAAPWWAARQICMIHDAAVFDFPEAYNPLFRVWYRLSFRRMARLAAQLLTVSEFSRQRLALHLRVTADSITVIGNGSDHLQAIIADDDVLERYGLVRRRFLLAVGSANPTKNTAALLEAYSRLKTSGDHRLVIVGGRNDRVFARTAGTDPAGVIRIAGLDDAGLKALYQHAEGLVFPSTYEGFGLPPLEAMACGCPVAVARSASLPEVCGDAALYFDPKSIVSMTEALNRLLTDDALRQRLSAGGHARAARFVWAGAAERLHTGIKALSLAPAAA